MFTKCRMLSTRRFLALSLIIICVACIMGGSVAETLDISSVSISVDGNALDSSPTENSDKAICLPLISMSKALGCEVGLNEISDGDTVRKVYTITPEMGSVLMVAFSITNGTKLSAVAISKDQILMPLKQSMTLVDGAPYLPTEFFETGLCATFKLDGASGVLYVTSQETDD